MSEIIYRPLKELKELEGNPRQIGKIEFEQLYRSLERNPDYFEARPLILSDRTGELVIIAGNMRYKAARKLRLKQVPTILLSGLTEEREREIIIRDNVNNGEWDVDRLANEWSDYPLAEWGVKGVEWSAAVDGGTGAGGDEFDTTPDEAQTRVQYSDLWQCGRHRVLCGDSTKAEDVARLMGGEKADAVVTDPPYGMGYDPGMSNQHSEKGNWKSAPKGYSAVIGDNKDFDPRPLIEIFNYCKEQFWWGADYYAERLPQKNEGSWLVWDKREGIEDVEFTLSSFELCWSRKRHQREIIRKRWMGVMGTESQDNSTRQHPTQKPLEVIDWILQRYCKSIVVDPFLGSGTTLIAAERTNRKCYGIEISPKYVNVCLSRFEAETGTQAVKVE